MNTTLDDAYKLGCGRLIFEHGALAKLGREAARLGKKAYLIAGPHAWEAVREAVEQSLAHSAVNWHLDVYAGPCSEEKAVEIASCCSAGCDLLIGAGGGRIMDLVKIAACESGLPVIAVPTISATCAAYTPLSVVYTPQGACRGTWYFQNEVNSVICDLDVLCSQQPRYLAAGMLDSMAKHVEITHHRAWQRAVGQDVEIARMLALSMYQDLMELGPHALQALAGDDQSLALERCIFHTIVTTGLISGIARGQYQSAIAHALYESVRTCYTAQSRGYLHGEIVAVCLIAQAHYLNNTDMAQELRGFMQQAGMPLSLAEIGAAGDVEKLAFEPPVQKFYLHDGDDKRLAAIINQHIARA